MDVTKPYKFIRFGAINVTKTYKSTGREPPRERKTILNTGQRRATPSVLEKPWAVYSVCRYSIALKNLILYVTQSCFRTGNRPSGLDCGRTATGKTPKSALRPAGGPISVLSR